MKILNILNGEATLHKFKQTELPGDVLVWGEILSEGPIGTDSTYDDFFSLRSDWICNVFNSTPAEYKRKVIDEFERLKDSSEYDEILLWFEFDLHCQINLIFLLNYFQTLNLNETKLALICPDQHPNHPDFRGIAELSPQELSLLTADKVYLTDTDLTIAANAWRAYSSQEKPQIESLLMADFGHLDKLKASLQAHLKRFPDTETGLNSIEEQLIAIVNSGIYKRYDIYHEFWKTTAIYGMGDAQIDLYLKKLVEQKYIPQLLT